MRLFGIALALSVWATQAAATPCVSASFDVPVPGATEVTSHVTDLPSPNFPGFWQEGRLGGYAYRIFANATGVVRGEQQGEPWAIEFQCETMSEICTFKTSGVPPVAATPVAERLGRCLIPALSGPPVDLSPGRGAGQPTPIEPSVSAQIKERDIVQEGAPCGLDSVEELTKIATLQRLLVLLGKDPGPVDGFLGPRTFAAMEAFIDDPGWSSSIDDVLLTLSEQHCLRAQ